MQLESTAVEDYPWLWIQDPALDWPQESAFDSEEEYEKACKDFGSEFESALESRDMDRVKTKPGMTLVVWTLCHLRGQAAWTINEMSRSKRNDRQLKSIYDAARCAIVSVEGFFDEDGKPLRLPREMDEELGCKALRGDAMAVLCNVGRGNLITSIGWAALRAQIPKKKP